MIASAIGFSVQPVRMVLLGLFLLLGLASGFLAGLLGIGGGVMVVPTLYYIFSVFGFPEGEIMRICVSTSLASTAVTSLGSTWAQHKRQALIGSVLKLLAPGLALGCVVGAFLTAYIPGDTLRMIFAAMALAFAFYFFFPKLPHFHIAKAPNRSLSLLGILFGSLSSLLGIGGGMFIIPALLGYQVPMRNVVALSSAGTMVSAAVGSLSYLVIAWDRSPIPETLGYIYLPAFLSISLCSLLTTTLGVKMSHVLHTHLIKKIFAVVLGITSIFMFLGR